MIAAQAEHARSPKVSHLVSLARRGAHEVALSAWAVVRWLWRHTRWVFLVTSLAFVVALLSGQEFGVLSVGVGWILPAVGLSLWQLTGPCRTRSVWRARCGGGATASGRTVLGTRSPGAADSGLRTR